MIAVSVMIFVLFKVNRLTSIITYIFYFICSVDATVSFNQSAYSINEGHGPVQPVLVLSNPSSFDIAVQVTDTNNTAKGK